MIEELAMCACLVACSANEDIPAPLVANVVPDHGVAGTVVRVDGEYFCGAATGDAELACAITGTVVFDATPSIATTWSETTIMVEVPTGVRGDIDIRVTVGGRRSNDVDFRVD